MLLVKILGSKNLLCAHGRAGQTQLHIFLRRISQSEIRNLAAAEKSESESEGGSRRRNFVSLRDKQKFLLFACPVASRGLCYGARPSTNLFQNSAFVSSLLAPVFDSEWWAPGSDSMRGGIPFHPSRSGTRAPPAKPGTRCDCHWAVGRVAFESLFSRNN